jgi:hypothetical protein
MQAEDIDDDILGRTGNTPLVRLRRLPGAGRASAEYADPAWGH